MHMRRIALMSTVALVGIVAASVAVAQQLPQQLQGQQLQGQQQTQPFQQTTTLPVKANRANRASRASSFCNHSQSTKSL